MRDFLLLLLLSNINGVFSKAHVFQGLCGDGAVLCAQLCNQLNKDTYECACWNDHVLQADGVGCRLNNSINPIWHSAEEYPDSDEYEGHEETAPVAFAGNNYAEFPVIESAYLETNISLEFKLNAQRDGILFFAGQFKGDDFISLALIGPNIMLRQDCGEGTIEDLYRGPFDIGIWHNVSIMRHYCYRTEVQADGHQPMKDEVVQFQNFKGITMDEGMFVGGAPRNVEFLDSKAGTDRGIIGCMRKVVVNGEVLLYAEQKVNRAVNQKHLEKCGMEKKERISSSKLEDVSKEDQFMEFDIATGFEEKVKALVGLNKTETTTSTSTTTTSLTTTVSSTIVAEEPHLTSALFFGSQFLSWNSPIDTIDYLEMSLRFKPKAQNGLLFLWRDGPRHAAVYLRQGYVLLEVNMGSDSLLLRSAEVVELGAWHKVELWRSGRGLLLKVDHQTWVEGELQAIPSEGVTDGGKIYLGGAEGALPDPLIGLVGFHGCLQHLRVNGRNMKMSSHNGVQECLSSTDACASASCPKGCSVIDETPVCLCEWPSYGATCQHESSSSVKAINFQGNSYLEFKDEKTLSEIIGDSLNFRLQLKVDNKTEQQMLLAFAGDHLKVDADFFRLRLSPQLLVEMEMNLGSGVIDLTHPTTLQPGRWHVISVIRHKKHVTLSIDDYLPISTVSPGSSEQLNVYSSFFIGGLPATSSGFHGCVSAVDIGPVFVNQPSQVSLAINIRDCPFSP